MKTPRERAKLLRMESMSKWEHRKEDLKDLSLILVFGGGAVAAAGFLIDTLIYSERATPDFIIGLEVAGISTAVLSAIAFVALHKKPPTSPPSSSGDS